MRDHCCDMLKRNLTGVCDQHQDPKDCPDAVIIERDNGTVILPIKDGGSSGVEIKFCPWCGSNLFKKVKVVMTVEERLQEIEENGASQDDVDWLIALVRFQQAEIKVEQERGNALSTVRNKVMSLTDHPISFSTTESYRQAREEFKRINGEEMNELPRL